MKILKLLGSLISAASLAVAAAALSVLAVALTAIVGLALLAIILGAISAAGLGFTVIFLAVPPRARGVWLGDIKKHLPPTLPPVVDQAEG